MNNFLNQVLIKICNDWYILWYAKLRNEIGLHWKIFDHDISLGAKSNNHMLKINVRGIIKYFKMNSILETVQCKHIKHYDNAVFMPYIHKDPTTFLQFNIFQGYKQKYISDEEFEKLVLTGVKVIQDHMLNVLCNGNQAYYEYLDCWLSANLV